MQVLIVVEHVVGTLGLKSELRHGVEVVVDFFNWLQTWFPTYLELLLVFLDFYDFVIHLNLRKLFKQH